MDLQAELSKRLAVCERATGGPLGIYKSPSTKQWVVGYSAAGRPAYGYHAQFDQEAGAQFFATSSNQRPGELRALAEAWNALAEATTNYGCPPHLAARLDEALARIAALLEGKP